MTKAIFTKIIVLLLIVSMLAIGLIGCGDDSPTKPATTTSNNQTDNPKLSYPAQLDGIKPETEGKDITFIFVDGSTGGYTADSIWIDADAADIDDVDQATLERNNRIEADLGVTIVPNHISTVGIDGLQAYTKASFDSQLPDIDVYCGYQYFDISLATQGHLYNLNDLTNAANETLIDVSKPYWATNYIESITYNDYMYWVTGDLSLRYAGGLYCTFVNTDLYDMKVKAAYGDRSIYQIVRDGDWHMQTMIDMADLADEDIDNSGKIEEGEISGFVYQNNDIWDGLAFGCQVQFGKKVETNAGDEITVTLHTDKKATAFAKFCTTLFEANYTLGVEGTDAVNQMNTFASGEALFAVTNLYQSAIFLADMENFAIIPTPKLNKEQKAYASGCHDSLTIYGISRYSDAARAAAATLELMAYYGSQLVAPVFYESYILGSRTLRDDESIDMIELIRKGFDSDFVAAWSHSINDIVHIYRVKNQCKNFSTQCNARKGMWVKQLGDLLTKLTEAAEKA